MNIPITDAQLVTNATSPVEMSLDDQIIFTSTNHQKFHSRVHDIITLLPITGEVPVSVERCIVENTVKLVTPASALYVMGLMVDELSKVSKISPEIALVNETIIRSTIPKDPNSKFGCVFTYNDFMEWSNYVLCAKDIELGVPDNYQVM